ncbi:predicted protein [Scheffersomyces stipitis CBS 6054]|uniref:Transcription factor Pcc1 n=1 Tax=Scheffersomyces stipitis (strain ATCC 58785 / CBS 6054 / NBRC 10063 / NRRL Y-11545) TaxID=322104 RepID=A3LZP9_PICST|nr:predicted protein [Scheffersomyces stipitis CBS 6054]ABN68581.1 predicted protein [Scheffersomyces stipitis CBS 6054]
MSQKAGSAKLSSTLSLSVPFENEKQATIACKSLSPDPILKADELVVTYKTEGSSLVLKFEGISDRVIRVAISNFIDNLKTVVECMDEFDGKKDFLFEQY